MTTTSPNLINTLCGFPPLQHQALLNTFALAGGVDEIDTLNLGKSGTAGTLNIFPTTASKGKSTFTVSDNSGNTTTTFNVAAQAGAVTYTVPDAGASASFVMTQGTQTLVGNKTFSTGITFGAGGTITGDIGTGTCVSNAVTISKMAGTITTESLSTAGGANQAITLTNTLIATTSNLMVQYAGGTNTTRNITLSSVSGTGSATITIYNNTASTALNGTLILKFLLVI